MKTIRCPQCNLADWENVVVCKRCKFEFQTVAGNEFAEESLESPFQREGSEFGRQQMFNEPESESPAFEPQAPPLPEERFNQNTYQSQQNYAQPNNQPRYSYSSPQPKLKIKMAVTSMILGILGMPLVPMLWGGLLMLVLAMIFGTTGVIIGGIIVLLSVPSGLVLGIISLVKSSRRPSEYGGKPFAIAGIICSGLGILTLPLIAAIAIPNVLASKRAANEGSAISSLRTLSEVENQYRQVNGGHCGDLSELESRNLIDPVLGSGQKAGYSFLVLKLPSINGGCEITATPLSTSEGTRSFYFSTEEGIIRAANKQGEVATQTDPPLDTGIEQQPPKIAASDDFTR